MGSAVFNILVIIGVCGIFAGQVGDLFSRSLLHIKEKSSCLEMYRDLVFFFLIDDLSHLVASLPGLCLLHHLGLGFNSGETS